MRSGGVNASPSSRVPWLWLECGGERSIVDPLIARHIVANPAGIAPEVLKRRLEIGVEFFVGEMIFASDMGVSIHM